MDPEYGLIVHLYVSVQGATRLSGTSLCDELWGGRGPLCSTRQARGKSRHLPFQCICPSMSVSAAIEKC